MSSCPATASSSSSQSSRLSWQPSQEANFHTARRGRRTKSNLPYTQKPGDAVVAEDRSVATDKGRSKLTMPTQADRAFHIALHRDKNPVHCQPTLTQRIDGKPHHDLRPAHHRQCMIGIDWHMRAQSRYDADISSPIRCGVIDRDSDVDIDAPPPRFEFSPVEDVGRPPPAIEHGDPAVTLTVSEHAVNHWA